MPCHVIGIGGTGNKCLEAFLHCCAAGLGPADANIAIVDQDRANGNVFRLRDVLDVYRRLYRDLHSGRSSLGNSPLFGTQIKAPDDPVWSPLPDLQVTLEAHFNRAGLRQEAQLLFDALFEERRERAQPLDEGFRGRPAVGAAAMYSAAAEGEGFWSDLFEDLEAQGDDPVRIVVLASIFGGTGAAGFPSIARLIRNQAQRHEVPVQIGGILLLPYFKFPDPAQASGEHLTRADDFLHTTQQALLYYHDLLRARPGLFNHLYVIGAARPFTLPNLGPGSNNQKNEALLPELIAALAALHFLRNGAAADASVMLRAGHMAEEVRDAPLAVEWNDIPTVRPGADAETQDTADAKTHDARDALGTLLRFAIAFQSFYKPLLIRNAPPADIARQTWFYRLITRPGIKLHDDPVQSTLTALDGYCDLFVSWCRDLSRTRHPDDLRVKLFAFDALASGEHHGKRDQRALNGSAALFDHVVGVPHARRLPDMFSSLSAERTPHDRSGLGVFVDQLFRSCRLGGQEFSSWRG
jgi:hypothetical protein